MRTLSFRLWPNSDACWKDRCDEKKPRTWQHVHPRTASPARGGEAADGEQPASTRCSALSQRLETAAPGLRTLGRGSDGSQLLEAHPIRWPPSGSARRSPQDRSSNKTSHSKSGFWLSRFLPSPNLLKKYCQNPSRLQLSQHLSQNPLLIPCTEFTFLLLGFQAFSSRGLLPLSPLLLHSLQSALLPGPSKPPLSHLFCLLILSS